MKRETSEKARKLPSNWSTMTDIDRAEAVKRLLDAGMSGRKMATALNCSESLIRHLKPLAEASPEEKRLARLGQISTRELKRRIADRHAQQAQKKETALERTRLEAAHRGAEHILQWFNKDEKIAYPYAEQILLEARRKLREDERDGRLPKEKAPPGLAVAEIIRRCGLQIPACTDDISFVERYASWLDSGAITRCQMAEFEKRLSISP